MNYQGVKTREGEKKPYFSIIFEPDECPLGLIFVGGIAVGGRTPERVLASRYALDVVKGFFLSRGKELTGPDPSALIERILFFINRKLRKRSEEKGLDFFTDLTVLAAQAGSLFVVGTGDAAVFVRRGDEIRTVQEEGNTIIDHLGRGEELNLSEFATDIQGGDLVVTLSPPLAEVFRSKDISSVLKRSPDPEKAALIINTLATRMGLEGALVSMLWEVPELPGVEGGKGEGMLAEESEEEGEPARECSQADGVKESWLGKWLHRRKE